VDVLKRSDVVVSDAKKSQFKTDNVDQDLKRLLPKEGGLLHNLEVLEKKHVMGSIACLIHYLDVRRICYCSQTSNLVG
jgi:hypothetical protein